MDRKNGHQEDLKLKIFKNLHLAYLLQKFVYLMDKVYSQHFGYWEMVISMILVGQLQVKLIFSK